MHNKGFWGMLGINILLILIFFLYITGERRSPEPSLSPVQETLQQQIIKGINTTSGIVVQIVAEDTSTYYQEENFGKSFNEKQNILKKGSGIIISKQGYIITNNHVLDNPDLKYSIITSDGIVYPVKNIWKDDLVDIAILSVETSGFVSSANFIPLDSPVEVGQLVLAVGNPLSEYPNTFSLGIISGKGRKISVDDQKNAYYGGLYQTDAALNPGNSGGPLINLSHEVIGMITAISRGGNNIGFALPLTQDFIDTTLSLIHQYHGLSRPYLGISYTDTFSGATIDTIFSGSPVQGQLLVGDTIVAIDNHKLSSSTPLLYYLYTYKPGNTVIFTIQRGDTQLTVPLVLGQKTL